MTERPNSSDDLTRLKAERADHFYVQSSRGLMILNSGAVIAVLGLLQALYAKDLSIGFKYFAALAGLLYLIGALLAVWMLWSKYEYIRVPKASSVTGFLTRIGADGQGAYHSSAACFGIGTLVVLVGVICALP